MDDNVTQEGLLGALSGAGKNILRFVQPKHQISDILGQVAKDHDLRLEMHGSAKTSVRIVEGGFDVVTSFDGVVLDPVLVPKK